MADLRVNLSDAQSRALIALCDLEDSDYAGPWTGFRVAHQVFQTGMGETTGSAVSRTLTSLERRGLVKVHWQWEGLEREFTITDEGRALVRSMGD